MRIGITGCAGRMGQALVREILGTAGAELAGGTERPGSPDLGRDIGQVAGLDPLGLPVSADAAALFAASDAVIDFTSPAASVAHAALAAASGTALVVGTTGLKAPDTAALHAAAAGAAIVHAPNMSLGVNVLMALVERTAAILGPEFDIEIVEMHHRHKVDAPSGTALGLGRAAAAGRKVELDAVKETVRDGITGARAAGKIGFATLRGGDVIGDHSVIFAGDGERLELAHKASSRSLFAKGAVRAALWTKGQAPGVYSMRDVLGL